MFDNNKNKLIFKPNKKLGQNFLINDDFLKRIVDSFSLTEKTKIIEVGPGYGNLTRALLNSTSNPVFCIEKDENLFNFLNSSDLSKKPNVKFFLHDVLDIDWEEFLKQENISSNNDELIIVGNLPYNISNVLITKLIEKRHFFKRFVFLVQKEVAQRWVANPFNYKNKYSNFSIFINYFCKTSLIFEIPKRFFKPIPEVDGALVVLEIEEKYQDFIDEKKFFFFIRNCFRFRRKTLFNNIKSLFRKEIIKCKLDYDIKIRPQDIDVNEYLILFDKFYTNKKIYRKKLTC